MRKIALTIAMVCLVMVTSQALAMNPMLMKQASQSKGAQTSESVALPENLQAEDIDAVMARLNDDQVRRLLIAELQADAAAAIPGCA